MESVPPCDRGLLDVVALKGPLHPKPFCDFMILSFVQISASVSPSNKKPDGFSFLLLSKLRSLVEAF